MTTLKRTSFIVLLLALGVLLFSSARSYFRADDFFLLETHLSEVSQNPATIVTMAERSGHYRPMVKVFWLVTYPLFGLWPLGYNIVIIAVFLMTQWMFFHLGRALIGNALSGYIAVLLFLVQVNAYLYTNVWIAGATNIFSGLFAVTMILCYARFAQATSRRYLYYFLSLLSFGLGLLTREIFLLLFPLLVAFDFLFLWLDAYQKKELLPGKLLGYLPFVILMVGYLSLRSVATGSNSLSGGKIYVFSLDSHLVRSFIFFGLQLGFLPGMVVLSSLPSLLRDKVRFRPLDIRVIAYGLLFALVAVAPLLFLDWTSPTWLYLPAFGTTLAAAAVFQRILSDASNWRRNLLFYGTLAGAMVGILILFFTLGQARYWRWGGYTRGVIEQVQEFHPDLPPGATLYFIDGNDQDYYGLAEMFGSRGNLGAALRIWYDETSLRAVIVKKADSVETAFQEEGSEKSLSFFLEYQEGALTDRTDEFRDMFD